MAILSCKFKLCALLTLFFVKCFNRSCRPSYDRPEVWLAQVSWVDHLQVDINVEFGDTVQLRYGISKSVSLSVSLCQYHLTRSARFSIYKGKNALNWRSIIIYQMVPPHTNSVTTNTKASSLCNTKLSQLDLIFFASKWYNLNQTSLANPLSMTGIVVYVQLYAVC